MRCHVAFLLLLLTLPTPALAELLLVTSTASSGPGSLTEAINQANTTLAEDRIEFRFGGNGTATINGPFPNVTQPLVIDAYAGLSNTAPNTLAGRGNDAQLRIHLVTSGWNILTEFQMRGVALSAPPGGGNLNLRCTQGLGDCAPLVLRGNYFGTNTAGVPSGGYFEVLLAAPADSKQFLEMRIGLPTTADRNLFLNAGLRLRAESVTPAQILNNSFGIDRAGQTAPTGACQYLFNGLTRDFGLILQDDKVRVGGLGAQDRNLFGCGALVEEQPLLADNERENIQFIGNQFDASGSTGSSPYGAITIQRRAAATGSIGSIVIGGTAPGAGNSISHYPFEGILLNHLTSASTRILANRIFDNEGLAIDLGDDGITANDVDDVDFGPNLRQNFPVLRRARVTASGDLLVELRLNHGPDTESYEIELFDNDRCHPLGHGPAQRPIARLTRTVGGDDGPLALNVASTSVVPGRYLTATSKIASTGETSELSGCLRVANDDVTEQRLQGRVFLDINGNGSFEPAQGDVGLSATYVFVDLDADGLFDGDTEALATTDANGLYSFTAAPAELAGRSLQALLPLGSLPSAGTPNPRPITGPANAELDFGFRVGIDPLFSDSFED